MAEKAKKPSKKSNAAPSRANKSNKNQLIGICAGIIVVIAIIVITIVAINANSLNDSYFVSDGSKYVLTIDSSNYQSEDGEDSEDSQYIPLKSHFVYTYEGDTITGLKSYYVYADAASAKSAYEAMQQASSESSDISQIELSGKYVIITANEETYKNLTASDVKQQIELMEILQNSAGSDDTEVEVTDGTEEAATDDTEE